MDATPATDHDEEQPWSAPLPGENPRWYHRFAAYLALGAARSVRAVYNAEQGNEQSRGVPASWHQASHRFDWAGRAQKYDAWRRAVQFATGNAQDIERIKKLDVLIEKLCDLITKIIEQVDPILADLDQLSRLIAQFLAALDLLAKHTGGYGPQRIEHTGKDGGKIEVSEEHQMQVFIYIPKVEALPEIEESKEENADEQ